MPSNEDLSDLLAQWPYDPGDYVREIVGADGRKKLQVRFPMGVEQYELDGRPDGLKPMGYESFLEYFLHLRRQAAESGQPDSFRLSPEDCESLRDEAMIYSYRYDLLFRRKDYERAASDTSHNLSAFDLMAGCAESLEDAESLEVHRPVALRLHYASRAMVSLKRHRHDEALRLVRLGLQRLRQLEPIDDRRWRRERRLAIRNLHRLARRIRRARPLSQKERLQKALKRAVAREDYEVAAQIRDQIASLSADDASPPDEATPPAAP
jgi:hypothetical protein